MATQKGKKRPPQKKGRPAKKRPAKGRPSQKKADSSRGIFINSEYHNLITVFIGIFLIYSLNAKPGSAGFIPDLMQTIFKGMFGGLAFLVPIFLIIFGILGFIEGNEIITKLRRTKLPYFLVLFLIVFYGLVNYATIPTSSPVKPAVISDIIKMGVSREGCGFIPTFLTYYLTKIFGVFGAWLLAIFATLIMWMHTFNISINSIIDKIKGKTNLEKAPEGAGWHTKFNVFKKNALDAVSEEVEVDEDDAKKEGGILAKLKSLASKPEEDDSTIISGDGLIDAADMDDADEGDKTIKIVGFNKADDDYLEILEGTQSMKPVDSIELLKELQAEPNDKDAFGLSDAKHMNDTAGSSPIPEELMDDFNPEQVKSDMEDNALQNFSNIEVMKPNMENLKSPFPAAEIFRGYKKPGINLLNNIKNFNTEDQKEKIKENADMLRKTLADFGVDATVNQVTIGPTITRYEIQPKPGVKVSKIVGLTDDIALSLAAKSIRMEAPIPGKSAIGIEVPNEKAQMVGIKDVFASKEFREFNSPLAFGLGKDVSGKTIVSDISSMPHLLIAGSTGSGKSVCVNTLINSILFKAKPDEVKLMLIDPKVVELANYNGIPHLLVPVVTDPKKAANALKWAVDEMNRRYKLFAETQVKDVKGYNEKADEKLPKIVIIIDELADLMMASANEVEDHICRLAQMARAAGMHLIVATQRPSVDVITGLIKANIPSRIAFAVSSAVDSRTILDSGGAEKLLGKGDMLFYPIGAAKPVRIQGAFISEEESDRVIDFVKSQVKHDDTNKMYQEEIIEKIHNPVSMIEEDTDELLPEAIRFVVENGQASSSMLQRKFRIGFNRAARLVDSMEERSIVGPSEGSRPRKVLISVSELENMNRDLQ